MAKFTIDTDNYNFEQMQEHFTDWSLKEIAQEYASITQKRNELMKNYSFKDFIEQIEEIDDARDFLGHYLALNCCQELGVLGER